jgi:hypothetical protein
MVRIVRAERPDIVHCIALRMVVLGGLAARVGGARRFVLRRPGSHVWSNHGPIERGRAGCWRLHRRALAERSKHALPVRKIPMIPGSSVSIPTSRR